MAIYVMLKDLGHDKPRNAPLCCLIPALRSETHNSNLNKAIYSFGLQLIIVYQAFQIIASTYGYCGWKKKKKKELHWTN